MITDLSHSKAFIFLYTIDNSPMDLSRESHWHRRILLNSIISGGEKWHGVCINHCRRKPDFPNICNDYLLANVIDSFLLLFWQTKASDFSRPALTRFSPLLFMFLWILFLAKYDKIMSYDELTFAQKEVSCKISRIEWNTRQDWSGFLDVSDAYIWFRVEVNANQTVQSSVEFSEVP